jgi:hypothetical protein
MIRRRLLAVVVLACIVSSAQGQASADEIAFWESVRNSKSTAELQAYLDRWPNGVFAPLARNRLAALGAKPAATAPKPAGAAVAVSGFPRVGDTWTYRLTYPRLRQWGQVQRPPQSYVVKAGAIAATEILDQSSMDGASPTETRHVKGGYLVSEGVTLFSPYLVVFQDIRSGRRPSVEIRDSVCSRAYRCTARVKSIGSETITTPAGQFEAIKVTIEHEWAAFSTLSSLGSAGADMNGGRTLTVWYSPQAKRAVKFESRLVAGAIPPVDANFDLELVSYSVQ